VKGKPELSLRGRALQALARRELSRAELHAKLMPHVTDTDDVGMLLDDLEKRGWLSDVRALEQTVRIRSARLAPERIAHELRQKASATSSSARRYRN
jgi:regulatory protein